MSETNDDEPTRRNRSELHRALQGLPLQLTEDEQLLEEESIEENQIEELLDKTGFGAFHLLFVFLFGLITASNTIGLLCVTYAMPVADDDLKLTSQLKGSVTAGLLVGMTVGTYMLGRLSDAFGRKTSLVAALVISSLCYVLTAFSFHWIVFLVTVTLAGIGVGGTIPPTLSYVSEFFTERKRAPAMFAILTFSDLGGVLVALLALLIMGNYIVKHTVHIGLGFVTINNWRLFILCCSLPPLLLLVPLLFVPESPSFLFHKKKYGKLMQALKVISLVNKMCPCFRVRYYAIEKPNNLDQYGQQWEMEPQVKKAAGGRTIHRYRGPKCVDGCCAALSAYLYQFISTTVHLYYTHLVRITLLLHVVYFTVEFVSLGDLLWSPEFFKRVNQPTEPLVAMNTSLSTSEHSLGGFYEDTVFVALSSIPGNVLSILLINVVGARTLLVLSGMLASIINFVMWLLPLEHNPFLIFSCISSAVMMVTVNALRIMATSLYPTSIRSTGLGVQSAVGRIGALSSNIIYALLIDAYPNTLMLISSALLLIGSGISILLPIMYRNEKRSLVEMLASKATRLCKKQR